MFGVGGIQLHSVDGPDLEYLSDPRCLPVVRVPLFTTITFTKPLKVRPYDLHKYVELPPRVVLGQRGSHRTPHERITRGGEAVFLPSGFQEPAAS